MDHSNIYSHIEDKPELQNYRINYRKLKNILLQDYAPAGIYAFLGVTEPIKPKKERFINYLESAGFIPLKRDLIIKRNGKYTQGGFDIFMALEIENLIPTFDIAIIVSGDIHFTVIVELLQYSLKNVHIWSWKEAMSSHLLKKAGKENVFYIDSIWDKIKRKRTRNKS